MSRGGFKIERTNVFEYDTSDRVSWLDRFADRVAKKDKTPVTAVEAGRLRNKANLMDQIQSIVGGKTRYSSVENAVRDYQERTGLSEYLRRVQSGQNNGQTKTAYTLPSSFSQYNKNVQDKLISYINNTIETNKGYISIPALQQDIKQLFRNDGVQAQDIDNLEVAKFLNDLIILRQRDNNSHDVNNLNIGKDVGTKNVEDDGSNTDFFKGLLPNNGT